MSQGKTTVFTMECILPLPDIIRRATILFFYYYGAATLRAEHAGGASEGDSGGGHTGRDDDIRPWPTLVIETGYS